MELTGGTDIDDLIGKLKTEKFETVFGAIGFDDKGDVNAPGYVFYEWSDGSYEYTNM